MKLSSICRTKEIRGFEFPGIIHNGGYFLTDLQVFADGLVNCWEMVDLPMFKRKLGQGWVVTTIPEYASLNIHGVGSVRVISPKWEHTPKTIVKFVQEVIKALNPRMENLHDCHGRDIEEVNGVRYAAVSTGNPRPWKTDKPISPLVSGDYGDSLRHFRLRDGVYHLVTIHLFKDDSVIIYGAGEPEVLRWDELLVQLEHQGQLRFPEAGARIRIDRLVTFIAGEWDYRVDYHELTAEFHDLHTRVHGRSGAIQECVMAFRRYNGEQTIESLNKLREKYEAVPEHLRMYCGDMDVKDIPIRMVLYDEGEIENWSHYQIAKARGEELPSIEIPKPPDTNA